ncbi:G-type lectin S-receptor-like serine/threonine-protein kinase [Dorcoceras hygrometricum]|uniref:G-type lectin S-receptor-like serine/threonine-protein kinase n=1 Tax=Dorcoceras hygrometricum TaxID=472368 RepID=A0A2Z7BVA4_9LAMI|nr:G-type lectin S-receptor-like serine/threonine-protein kinase [Dorcoceras hygrometricum]
MSLFDLRDVCMVIGSLATLDLPMVVDLIGIFVLKGPYCTITMTNWFLQALSVIPRGSWGDVARRFTMIRWASPKIWFRSHTYCGPTASCIPEPLRVTQVLVTPFPHENQAQFVEYRRRKDGSATS